VPTEDVARQEQLRGSPIKCVARVSDSNREAVATQSPGLLRSGGYPKNRWIQFPTLKRLRPCFDTSGVISELRWRNHVGVDHRFTLPQLSRKSAATVGSGRNRFAVKTNLENRNVHLTLVVCVE